LHNGMNIYVQIRDNLDSVYFLVIKLFIVYEDTYCSTKLSYCNFYFHEA